MLNTIRNGALYDAAVIGAGPAGSTAARALARAGARVALIEKEHLPRYKCCGGGLLARARRLIDIDIGDTVQRECRAAELHFHARGMALRVERDQPIVHMTMRADLDRALAESARAAGAEVIEGCRLSDVRRVDGAVELRTARGTVRARFAVAADGAAGVLAGKAGWPAPKAYAPAVECEAAASPEAFKRFSGAARFDFDVIDGGYGWVFPKRERLSIGVGCMRRGGAELGRALKRYMEVLGLEDARMLERRRFIIPLAPRKAPLARERIFLVGDAAGLADPVTGEGITNALKSGTLAAEALLAAGFESGPAEADYHRRIDREILRELAAGRRLARYLYRRPRLRDWAFRTHGQRLCEIVADVMTGDRTFAGLRWRMIRGK
jgi:geranylgeranyl reductase family protein